MDTLKFNRKNVKMIAHRGLSGIEKENTNSAFVAAGNRSYYGVETDVHVTADGRFIIIHDENTNRVGIDNVDVESTTFDTLRKIQLCDIDGKKGRNDLLLPELCEYIAINKKYGKMCVLELKNYMEPQYIAEIVEVIKNLEYLESVIFISFCLNNLLELRKLLPEQHAQFLIENEWRDEIYDVLKENRFDLDIDRVLINKEIIDKVHALGQEVNCWTVNTVEEGEKLAGWGVDYITTNILE